MYTTDNVERHIWVIISHYQEITKVSPGDNFYTVQLFPLIRPRSGIEERMAKDGEYYQASYSYPSNLTKDNLANTHASIYIIYLFEHLVIKALLC